MLGAIIGDLAGSRFEWRNIKKKDFTLFHETCRPTDDSIMTIAVAKAIMESISPDGKITDIEENTIKWIQKIGRHYLHCGYGRNFMNWIFSDNPVPYGSYGNGAAMRVSPCGDFARSLEEAKDLARAVTEISHNHPESIKAAEAIASAIYLGRHGASKEEIREYIEENYYVIDFTLDEIREDYTFDVSCQGSVPQAFAAFFEADDFEDTIRNAISIGGDSDTIAAIAGSLAESCYPISGWMIDHAMHYLNHHLREITEEWYYNGYTSKERHI